MASHPPLQMVASAARLDGRLRSLARSHAVLGTPPPPLHHVLSRRRTLLCRWCIRRRSSRLLHSALRGTHRLCPFLLASPPPWMPFCGCSPPASPMDDSQFRGCHRLS